MIEYKEYLFTTEAIDYLFQVIALLHPEKLSEKKMESVKQVYLSEVVTACKLEKIKNVPSNSI